MATRIDLELHTILKQSQTSEYHYIVKHKIYTPEKKSKPRAHHEKNRKIYRSFRILQYLKETAALIDGCLTRLSSQKKRK